MSDLTIEHTPPLEHEAPSDEERLIAQLARHPGWLALQAATEAHKRAWGERIATQITSGGKPFDADKAKLEYTRGYFQGQQSMAGRVAAAKARVDAEEAS
jgi:hypothetical protein